jgi:F-type H+-transporting ATPase subunit gamma
MSDTLESLRRKIERADELKSVVRTMKSLSAARVGQYQKSVESLVDYYRTIELGLIACLNKRVGFTPPPSQITISKSDYANIVVFGSDQGLAGQFDEVLSDFVLEHLPNLEGKKNVWTVGERIHTHLSDAGIEPKGLFELPNSANSISQLVWQILIDVEAENAKYDIARLYMFHNRRKHGEIFEPVITQVMPLDETWMKSLQNAEWPSTTIPETLGPLDETLNALVREYIFITLFRSCAESLESENICRLGAMQRAENNIDDLLHTLNRDFNHIRQSSIDEELFELIASSEASSDEK